MTKTTKNKKKKSRQYEKKSEKDSKAIDTQLEAVLPVFKKLKKATTTDDRIWALNSISNLILDSVLTPDQLLKHQILNFVLELIQLDAVYHEIPLDNELESVSNSNGPKPVLNQTTTACNGNEKTETPSNDLDIESSGFLTTQASLVLLANLLQTGGSTLSVAVVQAGGLSRTLKTIYWIFAELQKSLQNPKEKTRIDMLHLVAEQAISVLWTLAESSSIAVSILTTKEFVGSMTGLLGDPRTPWGLSRVCGHALVTVTEDNYEIIKLFDQENLQLLHSLYQLQSKRLAQSVSHPASPNSDNPLLLESKGVSRPGFLSVELLVLGVLKNIGETAEGCDIEWVERMTMDRVTAALNVDLLGLGRVVINGALIENLVADKVEAVGLALEMLANLYSEDHDQDQESDDEMDYQQDMNEIILVQDMCHENKSDYIPFGVSDAIISNMYRIALLTLIPLQNTLATLKLKALVCIANLYLNRTIAVYLVASPGQVLLAKSFWLEGMNQLIKASRQAVVELELVDSIVGALWAIASTLEMEAQGDMLAWFFGVFGEGMAASDELKVKCIGILTRFAMNTKTIDVNKRIGEFIINELERVAREPGPRDVGYLCELLNGVYDIWNDGSLSYDGPVFVGLGMNQILSRLVGSIRAKVKSVDSSLFPGIRERADEILVNLEPFIRYKTQEAQAIKPENRSNRRIYY